MNDNQADRHARLSLILTIAVVLAALVMGGMVLIWLFA
jgi:hypothetical protein